MVVFTFLEEFDFTGKTILPLCTNEGSGMGSSERDIAKAAKGAALKKGLPINGSSVNGAKPKVEKWLKENGVI
jgi:flavodoxin